MNRYFLLAIVLFVFLPLQANFTKNVYEGHLEIIYVDNKYNPQTIYRLRLSDGSFKKLKVPKDFNYAQGTFLRIKTKEKTDKSNQSYLEIERVLDSNKKFRLNGLTNEATGNQKIMVVLVTDASFSESHIPYSLQQIEEVYFGNTDPSLKRYISEVSGGRLNLSGEAFPTLAVDGLCQSDNLFDRGVDESIVNTVDTFIEDFETYDFVSVVIPDLDECLNGASGIGTVGRSTYTTSSGELRLGFNFVRSYNVEDYDRAFVSTVFHEFGHNLGLNHSNSNICGTQIFTQGACPGLEYGDGHNIMGTAVNLAHFNMIQKEDLGWVASSEQITINSDGFTEGLELIPASSTQEGLKMIKVRRDDGRFYVIEYRQPIGYDAILERSFYSLDQEGFLVYLDEETIGNRPIMIDSTFSDIRSQAELINENEASFYSNFELTTDMYSKGLFGVSENFNDDLSDIEISATSLNPQRALINVIKGPIDTGNNNDSNDDNSNNNNDSGDDNTELDIVFIDANTLGSQIDLRWNKRKKAFISVVRDTSTTDSKVYRIKVSDSDRKLVKVKRKNFKRSQGAFIRMRIAPEKAFIKRGYTKDNDGFYTATLLLTDDLGGSENITVRFKASR